MVWEARKNIQNALRQVFLWQGGNQSRPKNSTTDLWLTHLLFSREIYPLLSMPVKPAIPLTATVQAMKDGFYITARIISSSRTSEKLRELLLLGRHEGGTELEKFRAMPVSTRFPGWGDVSDQPEDNSVWEHELKQGVWELTAPAEVRAAEVLGE